MADDGAADSDARARRRAAFWKSARHLLQTNPMFMAAFYGGVLGVALATGAALLLLHSTLYGYGMFMIVTVLFHALEFTWVALFHRTTLRPASFMLPHQHSREFLYAFCACQLEFWLEWLFVPASYKACGPVIVVGAVVCILGQALRTMAMATAESNFTHMIAEQKLDGHELVTDGVYAYFRHPSYCGWFWWAIATQLLLCNPLCVVAYVAASWKFFSERIVYEEQTLREHFGEAYVRYAARTRTGIPFIK